MAKDNLFEREYFVLHDCQSLLEKPNIEFDELLGKYKELLNHHEEIIDQARLVTKVSDKLQNKLTKAHDAINAKNIELQNTIDELTKARAGRTAATVILILGVLLFMLSEVVIDPYIDSHTGGNIYISIGVKGLIALMLKPIESLLEGQL
ncbi:MAG: hypothetical protein K2Q22_01020, partial [Cytophagales bacterium]|nr:hypothetical protein [Cytophagales bacterium]